MTAFSRLLAGYFLINVLTALANATPAAAADDLAKFCAKHLTSPRCDARASGDAIVISGTRNRGATPTGTTTQPISNPGPLGDYATRQYTPACTGNTRLDGGTLCGLAVNTCPQPGFVRFWIYEARFNGTTNQIIGDWYQVTSPSTVCLGAGAPGVPKPVVIAAQIQRDFKRLVVLQGLVKVQPTGTTLVNFQTAFYTEAVAYDLPPITILGSRVQVRATPVSYDWSFGDGAQASDAGPGARGTTQVSHRYAGTGPVGPNVVITWAGSYTVDGGAAQQVVGTAQTTGPPTALLVAQARSELVSR